jgi:hypothetical protein
MTPERRAEINHLILAHTRPLDWDNAVAVVEITDELLAEIDRLTKLTENIRYIDEATVFTDEQMAAMRERWLTPIRLTIGGKRYEYTKAGTLEQRTPDADPDQHHEGEADEQE